MKLQDAEFYDGTFRIRQSRGVPITEVRLAGGGFSACSSAAAVRSDSVSWPGGEPGKVAAVRRLPHRVVRLLGASGKGRFQTVGRYAAATVRGTIWLTEDYCDGTLVKVRRGVVSVSDLVRHKTVTVRAGHSYFAHVR